MAKEGSDLMLKVIGAAFMVFVFPFIVYGSSIVLMIKGWGLEAKSWPWLIGIYGFQITLMIGFSGLKEFVKYMGKE